MANGPDELKTAPTRTSSAWTLAAAGLVVTLLMLIFILQNGRRVQLDFLWLDFHLPLGAAMALAAVLGGLIVVLLGVARLAQVRLAARRHRKADREVQAAATSDVASRTTEPADLAH